MLSAWRPALRSVAQADRAHWQTCRANPCGSFAPPCCPKQLLDLCALLPLYLIEQELSAGKLQIVFDRPMATENSYYVVMPDGKREHALGVAFTTWLLSQVSSKGATES
jgi:hypothetical protein